MPDHRDGATDPRRAGWRDTARLRSAGEGPEDFPAVFAAYAGSRGIRAFFANAPQTGSVKVSQVPLDPQLAARLRAQSIEAAPYRGRLARPVSQASARQRLQAAAATAVLVRLDVQGRAIVGELLRLEPNLNLENLEATVVAEGFVVLTPAAPAGDTDGDEVPRDRSLRVPMDARKRLSIPAGLRYRLGVVPGSQLLISGDAGSGEVRLCNLAAVVVALEAGLAFGVDEVLDSDPLGPAVPVVVGAAEPDNHPEGPLVGRTRRFR